ncbi:LytTR family transcriptional regulator DNA-binding domain-containing protein [Bacteroidales bacterium OttesenSCG-928-B11]|nr:LytTR family transcriptional regulator DNA-binding domain-containing protein [Bacteroidales bacterium OttesenSCG-928-B11]
MKSRFPFLQLILHSAFWFVIFYFFTRNSFLRPLAIATPYKEYLSVLFVMIMIYVNYFYLIPKYFLSKKFKIFFPLAIGTIVVAVMSEFFLVKPNIYQCASGYLPAEEFPKYYRILVMLLFFRNLCFLLFFFLLKLYQDLLEKYRLEKQTFADRTHCITILLPSKKAKIVRIEDIVYLSHDQNYTYFHMTNGKKHPQYVSLKDVEDTLPKDFSLRINKKYIVMILHVVDYNKASVTLDLVENGEPVVLPISEQKKDMVSEKLKEIKRKSSVSFRLLHDENAKNDGRTDECIASVTEENDKEELFLEENSLECEIFDFVLAHPNCSMPDIVEAIKGKSKSTIERSVRKLKAGGLVEHRNSTKKGGYYVVESGDDNTPA